jgi:outer membrane protein assembly factor BamE
MQKSLVLGLCVITVTLSGCNTLQELGDAVPDALGETPLLYQPTIQQGNVVTQEMVDKLKPGMNRRQVAYVLGTPLLVDAFHQDRWDYVYTKEVGGGTDNKTHIVLFFEDDVLVRIDGDFRPEPKEDPLADAQETVFSVPDNKKKEKGFFSSALESVGIDTDEEESVTTTESDEQQLPDMGQESTGDLPETVEEAQAEISQATESQIAEQAEEQTEAVEEATEEVKQDQEEEEKGLFSRALEVIGL